MVDCPDSHAAYLRSYRKTAEILAIRQARKEGAEAFRILVLSRFEGDLAMLEMNGRSAAEIIRCLALD